MGEPRGQEHEVSEEDPGCGRYRNRLKDPLLANTFRSNQRPTTAVPEPFCNSVNRFIIASCEYCVARENSRVALRVGSHHSAGHHRRRGCQKSVKRVRPRSEPSAPPTDDPAFPAPGAGDNSPVSSVIVWFYRILMRLDVKVSVCDRWCLRGRDVLERRRYRIVPPVD